MDGYFFLGGGGSGNLAVDVLCVLALRFYALLLPVYLVCGFLTH